MVPYIKIIVYLFSKLLLKKDLVSIRDTLDYLCLTDSDLKNAGIVIDWDNSFNYRCTYSYLSRMLIGDVNDPLLLQVLPQLVERKKVLGYVQDPLREQDASLGRGFLQKFKGRVLVVTTQSCPAHCRFCFRRNFDYSQHKLSGVDRSLLYEVIASDSSISEVILSGGDPLSLPDSLLSEYIDCFSKISHLKTIRIHTRYNIFYPARITQDLVDIFSKFPGRIVWVMHTNHANELNDEVLSSVDLVSRFMVLNQTVLLRNINDKVSTLVDLSYRLHEFGILPYYLHIIDKVDGVAHFDIDIGDARLLYNNLKLELPGYLLPRLAQEVPMLGHKNYIV